MEKDNHNVLEYMCNMLSNIVSRFWMLQIIFSYEIFLAWDKIRLCKNWLNTNLTVLTLNNWKRMVACSAL